MLQPVFTYSLTAAGLLVLADVTPAYDAQAAPGGYGGPNPAAAELAYFALVGQQQPGSYRFSATVYAVPGTALSFQLPGDGLYQAYVFAAPRSPLALRGLSAGQVALNPAGVLLYHDGTQVRELVLGTYSFEQLRELSPALVVSGDYVAQVLQLAGARTATDRLLLEYARQASRNRPQGGEDYAQHWLQAEATLRSVSSLTTQGRLPEAAAQLAALQQLLGAGVQPFFGQTARSTDWLQEQSAR